MTNASDQSQRACEDEISALRRQLHETTAFLETASTGLHRVAADGTILWANQAEFDLLGYSRDEYIGHNIIEFHADRPVIDRILACLSRGERLRNHPARMRCKDGSIKDVLIDSSVLFEDGEFVHTQCFTRDITNRKAADVSAQLLSAIVESSDDAIVSKDLNGTITSWNKGAERIFGYTASEVVGKSITIIIPPERLDEEPRILAQIRSGQRVDHFETIRRRKDGVLLNVSITVSPLRDGAGQIIGASKVARDITDTVRAKEKLEQLVADRTAHLQATIGELERFSYSMSHDMRAPLRAIHSFIEMVLEDASPRLTDSERDLLSKTVAAAARLDRLIQDVLAYSKVARDDIQLHPVDVVALLRQIIDERPDFHSPVSEIAIDCPTPPVLGHEAYLTQVITNLLGNAVKFVAPGVQPRIRITCERLDRRVRLCFTDNGIGIPEHAREKIFGMFQRMHAESEYPGTGIGLAIVRKAAERMHAAITVSAGANGGSCFCLDLAVAN